MSWVLIVDDDRAIREMLRYALEFEGYEVSVLCDGALVTEELASRLDGCVVLMDLMMPGVDGWEVCRRLRECAAALQPYRLVLMTASRLDAEECPAEVDMLVHKPFELDKLLKMVARLFSTLSAELHTSSVTDCVQQAAAS